MTRKNMRPGTVANGLNPLGLEWMSVKPRGRDDVADVHIPNLVHVLRNPQLYDLRSVEDAQHTAATLIEAVSGVAGFKSVVSGPTIYGPATPGP